jgi:hypothetical protein
LLQRENSSLRPYTLLGIRGQFLPHPIFFASIQSNDVQISNLMPDDLRRDGSNAHNA